MEKKPEIFQTPFPVATPHHGIKVVADHLTNSQFIRGRLMPAGSSYSPRGRLAPCGFCQSVCWLPPKKAGLK